MKKPCYIGFDTSNYTTSAALCREDGTVIANLKRPLPVGKGARGLRQSDAVFAHVKNLPDLCWELGTYVADYTPVAVGVSSVPRDAEDSYMPCFLSGKAAAYAFASAVGVPVYEFSHQNGHIMAAAYASGKSEYLLSRPFYSFHVSGGTTELLRVTSTEDGFSVCLIGETDDINAGQLIDRVGVAMGLTFPCGREMEKLASEYDGEILRRAVTVRDGKCSLSGAENIALRIYRESGDARAVAAFVFDFVKRTLIAMGEYALAQYGNAPVLFAGGVMSNHVMREELGRHFESYFADPAFSADNAAGIALLCRRACITEKQDESK